MTTSARSIRRRHLTQKRRAERRLESDHDNGVPTDRARNTYKQNILPYWRR